MDKINEEIKEIKENIPKTFIKETLNPENINEEHKKSPYNSSERVMSSINTLKRSPINMAKNVIRQKLQTEARYRILTERGSKEECKSMCQYRFYRINSFT